MPKDPPLLGGFPIAASRVLLSLLYIKVTLVPAALLCSCALPLSQSCLVSTTTQTSLPKNTGAIPGASLGERAGGQSCKGVWSWLRCGVG